MSSNIQPYLILILEQGRNPHRKYHLAELTDLQTR